MKKTIKLYGHYVSIHIRSIMQYKKSFFLSVIGQFLASFNVFLGITFLFERFNHVEGFNYQEVVLCYAIFLMGFSLAECISRGFDRFSVIVRKGEFDRVLLRPRSSVLQVLGSEFELTRIGRMLQAVVMAIYAFTTCKIDWNLLKIITVMNMVIGGFLIFTGIFMLYASMCFFTLEGLEVLNIFIYGALEFGKYPINIYGKWILKFCTYVIPYAIIQYYPLLYLLDRRTFAGYAFLPLLVSIFLIPCYLLWRCGIRHYQSSGS